MFMQLPLHLQLLELLQLVLVLLVRRQLGCCGRMVAELLLFEMFQVCRQGMPKVLRLQLQRVRVCTVCWREVKCIL